MTKGVRGDHEAATDPARLDEQRRQDGPPLLFGQRHVVLIQEVVVQPPGVEAQPIRFHPRVADLRVRPAHLGGFDAEAEGSRGHSGIV